MNLNIRYKTRSWQTHTEVVILVSEGTIFPIRISGCTIIYSTMCNILTHLSMNDLLLAKHSTDIDHDINLIFE